MSERCNAPALYRPCCMSKGHTTPEHWCCPMHTTDHKIGLPPSIEDHVRKLEVALTDLIPNRTDGSER